MAYWIKTTVRYHKTMDNGMIKEVTEHYLVDALSFTEAEARITEELSPFASGSFSVAAVTKSRVSSIVRGQEDEHWYQVKYGILSFDEKLERTKRTNVFLMLQASNFQEAHTKFTKYMADSIADFEVISVTETPIVDVFDAE